MEKEIQTLHQLTRDNAEELHHLQDYKLFRLLRQSIRDYRQLGETWDLPTLQFYFYQHDPDSLPF